MLSLSSQIEFVVLVTGRYHWLIDPLLYFYEKYMPVTFHFFSDRLIDGCTVDVIFPLDMNIYREPCGHLIKKALRQIDKPIVTLGFMDFLPSSPVDLHRVEILAHHMIEAGNIARGNLWAEIGWRVRHLPAVFECAELTIHTVSKTDRHIGQIGATSLMPALWSKDFLLEFIEDDWTLANIELPGQHKFIEQSVWHSVATFPGLFDPCHLLYTASPKEVRLSTISNMTDREYVAQFIPVGYTIT